MALPFSRLWVAPDNKWWQKVVWISQSVPGSFPRVSRRCSTTSCRPGWGWASPSRRMNTVVGCVNGRIDSRPKSDTTFNLSVKLDLLPLFLRVFFALAYLCRASSARETCFRTSHRCIYFCTDKKNFTDRLRELAIAMTWDHKTFHQAFTSSLSPVFKNLEDGDAEKWSERQFRMCPNQAEIFPVYFCSSLQIKGLFKSLGRWLCLPPQKTSFCYQNHLWGQPFICKEHQTSTGKISAWSKSVSFSRYVSVSLIEVLARIGG